MPGSVIFIGRIVLIHVTNTSVARQFNIAYAVFQVGNTNAQIVKFIRKFIGQTVDESTLFSIGTIFMSHSLSNYFSCFITSDVTFTLEVNAVNTLDDTGVGQLYYGIVCPAVLRNILERVCGKSCRAYCHGCN